MNKEEALEVLEQGENLIKALRHVEDVTSRKALAVAVITTIGVEIFDDSVVVKGELGGSD